MEKDLRDLYLRAIDFAAAAHGRQKVPGKSYSYVVHLSNVAMEVIWALHQYPVEQPGLALQCALLHDVLEDTPITFEELQAAFGKAVAEGVRALSKNRDLPRREQIPDSVRRILQHPVEIGLVKLADRITNLQSPPPHWSASKTAAYLEEARHILAELGHCHAGLKKRLLHKIEVYQKFIALDESG